MYKTLFFICTLFLCLFMVQEGEANPFRRPGNCCHRCYGCHSHCSPCCETPCCPCYLYYPCYTYQPYYYYVRYCAYQPVCYYKCCSYYPKQEYSCPETAPEDFDQQMDAGNW